MLSKGSTKDRVRREASEDYRAPPHCDLVKGAWRFLYNSGNTTTHHVHRTNSSRLMGRLADIYCWVISNLRPSTLPLLHLAQRCKSRGRWSPTLLIPCSWQSSSWPSLARPAPCSGHGQWRRLGLQGLLSDGPLPRLWLVLTPHVRLSLLKVTINSRTCSTDFPFNRHWLDSITLKSLWALVSKFRKWW